MKGIGIFKKFGLLEMAQKTKGFVKCRGISPRGQRYLLGLYEKVFFARRFAKKVQGHSMRYKNATGSDHDTTGKFRLELYFIFVAKRDRNIIKMKTVIIKYNAGNIESVKNALARLGVNAEITADHEKIKAADKVIFPGVGEASTTMAYLCETGLDELIVSLKQPVLGICLGLQLMCSHSEENDTKCLGIFEEKVKRFVPKPGEEFITKVPHMGWNSISGLESGIFSEELENGYVYFVHSYYAEKSGHTIATCNYIQPFSAALHRDNFYATQFHPEKSGAVGAKILENFLAKGVN